MASETVEGQSIFPLKFNLTFFEPLQKVWDFEMLPSAFIVDIIRIYNLWARCEALVIIKSEVKSQ